MPESAPSSFDWREHVTFPVKNNWGEPLPDIIVQDYLEKCRSEEEFSCAWEELMTHRSDPESPSDVHDLVELLEYLRDAIRKNSE
ncbi:MAG: hypothetical protein Q8O95_02105 [bacterium]|nr:hypothetical protein [bacterium]